MARQKTPKALVQQRQILRLIARRPMTVGAITGATEMNISTIKERLRELVAAEQVHVGGWEFSPGATRPTRAWLAGHAEDVPCPKRPPGSLPWPMARESELTPDQGWAPIRRARRAPIIRRDPMIAALFGEYQGVGA